MVGGLRIECRCQGQMQGHLLRGYCDKWAINHEAWTRVVGVAVVESPSTLNIEPASFADGLDVN